MADPVGVLINIDCLKGLVDCGCNCCWAIGICCCWENALMSCCGMGARFDWNPYVWGCAE